MASMAGHRGIFLEAPQPPCLELAGALAAGVCRALVAHTRSVPHKAVFGGDGGDRRQSKVARACTSAVRYWSVERRRDVPDET